MPGLLLTLSGSRDPQLIRRVVPALTALTCEVLAKKPAATMILLRHVAHEDWFIENVSLAERGMNSFRLEVTVTDETCTKDQKAAYQRAAFELLSDLIGNLHPHSNVHLMDVRASAYGYGGVTQEHRYQHAG